MITAPKTFFFFSILVFACVFIFNFHICGFQIVLPYEIKKKRKTQDTVTKTVSKFLGNQRLNHIQHDERTIKVASCSLNQFSQLLHEIFATELKLNVTLFNKVQKTLTEPDYSQQCVLLPFNQKQTVLNAYFNLFAYY